MDLGKKGFEMFFKPYQVEALFVLWENNEGANSRLVWKSVNMKMKISRASIINSLNDMVNYGILSITEGNWKGGHRRVYHHKYTESELKEFIVRVIINKLMNEYLESTKRAINSTTGLM
jgi:predicted transcriptional regulator